MKSKFNFGLLLAVITAYFFGATVALATGFDPIVGGLVSIIGASVSFSPKGVLRNGIDLTEVSTAIGQYMNIPRNAAQIWRSMMHQLELVQFARKKSGVIGRHVGVEARVSEVLQAYQKAFTPKGVTTFVPYISNVFHLKADHLLDDLDSLYESWFTEFFTDESKERQNWAFIPWVVHMHIIPRIVEDLNIASCRGSYVAPTPNVAGSYTESMDGLLTILATEISNSNIAPIITGEITNVNALEKLELFADGLPVKYANKGGVILCSHSVARMYRDNYRNEFGQQNSQEAKNNTRLDNYNITLQPIEAFDLSQRLLFTPTGNGGNLLWMYDNIFQPNSFQLQVERRDVLLLTDWHAGIGFNTLQEVWCNDIDLVVNGQTPIIGTVTPATGTDGDTLSLSGSGFTGATAVKFGATSGTSLNIINNTALTVKIPTGLTPGTVAVTVVTPAGTSNAVNITVS